MQSYAPYGFLQNPAYQCIGDFSDVQSGVLKSDDQIVGFGWVVPFPKNPEFIVSVGVGVTSGEASYLTRDDFRPLDVTSHVHTPFRFGYTIGPAPEVTAEYWTGDPGVMHWRVRVRAEPDDKWELVVVARAWCRDGSIAIEDTPDGIRISPESHLTSALLTIREDEPCASTTANNPQELARKLAAGHDEGMDQLSADSEIWIAARCGSEQTIEGSLKLDTGPLPVSIPASQERGSAEERSIRDSSEFSSSVPRLTGDFPDEFKNGFYYDFETTRLCTLPAVGIFKGPWPTWMVSMPRAVFAEGVVDMARLAYANPELAGNAILTLVRDTPDDNVPCVFASGEYNMVAEDGSTCGTSPAWCVPFFYLYDLYLRTLDSSWIEQLYPHLVRYVDFWLTHRTDAEGWITYKCTWEAGEDNNPRIDPQETGDNVISGFVRPVELQASVAHAGYVLSRFASIVGKPEDERRFEKIRNEYTNRTQELWDPDASRFRDWDCTAGSFVRVSGEESYWGADFTRQSPMSLTALLFDTATEDQKTTMRSEVRSFFRPPFTVWPSWASVVIEAAAALGMPDLCGSFAYETARRVYRITDRRDTMEFARPSPGSAAEYWPHALATFTGNDAYAWGAQTASFVIRHILGIRPTEGSGLGLALTPSLSPDCRKSGSNFGIDNLAHRGLRLSVEYRSDGDGTWHCTVKLSKARALNVRSDGISVYVAGARQEHRFSVQLEHVYELE